MKRYSPGSLEWERAFQAEERVIYLVIYSPIIYILLVIYLLIYIDR